MLDNDFEDKIIPTGIFSNIDTYNGSSFDFNNEESKHCKNGLFNVQVIKGSTKKKIRDYLGFFSNMGSPQSQNFCYFTIALKIPLKHLKITQKFSF